MFPGFPTRLKNDLDKIYREKILKGNKNAEMKMKIKIVVIIQILYKLQILLKLIYYFLFKKILKLL